MSDDANTPTPTPDSEPLKPCPFCGEHSYRVVLHIKDSCAYVCCMNCGANGPSIGVFEIEGSSKTAAFDKWNTRCETYAADLKRQLEEIQPRYDDEDVYIGCCECLQRIEEFFFVERENRQLRSELAALKTSAEDWHKVADDRSREIVRLREERDKLKTYCSALEEQLDSFGLQRAREKAP